jgi:hypothetical protein
VVQITRRLLAWGVLGLATGGFLVSLLTLLLSGGLILKTRLRLKSFGFIFSFHGVFSKLLGSSYLYGRLDETRVYTGWLHRAGKHPPIPPETHHSAMGDRKANRK